MENNAYLCTVIQNNISLTFKTYKNMKTIVVVENNEKSVNVNVVMLAKSVSSFYQHAPRMWGNDAESFVERFRRDAFACKNASAHKDETECIAALLNFYHHAFNCLRKTAYQGTEMFQGSDDGRRLGFIELMSRIKELKKELQKQM